MHSLEKMYNEIQFARMCDVWNYMKITASLEEYRECALDVQPTMSKMCFGISRGQTRQPYGAVCAALVLGAQASHGF